MSSGDVTIGFLKRLEGIMAGQDTFDVEITGGEISNVTLTDVTIASLGAPLPITEGGTGSITASAARTSLGLEIGADVQAYSLILQNTTASFTTDDETKLDGIEDGAQVNTVDSVNGATGVVVLDADDIDDAATTNKFATAAQLSNIGLVKVSANDTTPGDLETKLLVGDGLSLSTQNDGGNETRTIDLSSGAATDGQVLTADGAGGVAFEDVAGGGLITGGFKTDHYYFGFGYRPAAGSPVTADRLYVKPFIVTNEVTFNRVGLNVTTSDSGNARIGIYNFADGIPTTLITDFGTLSTSTTGNKEITISQTLTPGIYAVCTVFDAAPQITELNADELVSSLFGANSAGASFVKGAYSSFTYGSLPGTHPAITAYESTDRSGTWLRKV